MGPTLVVKNLSWLFVPFLLIACTPQAPPPAPVNVVDREVSFLADVKPILDSRCVVCHSCYNAACQLKLSSFEGLDRGGSKDAVYGTRLSPSPPTRLFTDAQTATQWRARGFHSVMQNRPTGPGADSVMAYMLDAKQRRPQSQGEYRAEASDLTCAATPDEAGRFLGKHSGRGMPFGFPALSTAENDLLGTWLSQGAQGPRAQEQDRLVAPSFAAATGIAKWEALLNTDDAKHAMTARYLYEHFFIAHLRFAGAPDREFFELVRSRTPSGEPIDIIATVRPYDDPGVARVYYRFRKIHSTIVYKTHIVVSVDDAKLARVQARFIDTPWLEPPHRMPFDDHDSANPFLVYAQIPPRVRYEFLLDYSEYVIRTFIRGPVCKGQVALNVIHDHFWVLFLDPAADETVKRPQFLIDQAHNLTLPTEQGSNPRLVRAFSNVYRDRYAAFYQAKNALYDEVAPDGWSLTDIWPGNQAADSPMLTVYRHFDSASVHRGALGDLPRTAWVIDYSQFERIYYALVAGFDVFGNVSHQANVRRYMDYLRVEGELNFISFLPAHQRDATLRSWYIGDGAVEHMLSSGVISGRPSRVQFATDQSKREFFEQVIKDRLRGDAGIALDPINYHRPEEGFEMPDEIGTVADLRAALRALNAAGTGFIRHVTDTEINVLLLRVRYPDQDDRFYSVVVNRWHDNVNSMFGESQRLDPARDTIDFLPISVGGYPNVFLDVREDELPAFVDLLEDFDNSDAARERFASYVVNRGDDDFWAAYDWFQQRLDDTDPVHAGQYDLNRYFPHARVDDGSRR